MLGCFYLVKYILFTLLLSIFIVILFLKIQIEIKIIVKNSKNHSFMIIRMLKGLLRLRLNLSLAPGEKGFLTIRKTDSNIEHKPSSDNTIKAIKRVLAFDKQYYSELNYLKSKIDMCNFSVINKVGTENAALTALITGSLYAIFSTMVFFLKQKFDLKNQKIVVLPFFQGLVFDLDLDCIFTFKMGHIIITGIKIIFKKLKGV